MDQSRLALKTNSILDLYFELFLNQVDYLIHSGLVKKYRKLEGNKGVLKGRLKFNKHIAQNCVQQERFYVCHTTYDHQHSLHCILFKTILLLKRIGALLLDFPDMPDIKVTESVFSKLHYNKKTKKYQKAIEIARLLLLNYHPDVRNGQNDVLALMFNMNLLWEKFVYTSLRKNKQGDTIIKAQNTKKFWAPEKGSLATIRPDIVIVADTGACVVLDTKWKNIKGANPSPDDLRQMYVYMNYYNADKVALLYPGSKSRVLSGNYYDETTAALKDKGCSIILLEMNENIALWQRSIYSEISKWMGRK